MAVTVAWDSRNPGRIRAFLKRFASTSSKVIATMAKPHRAALTNLTHMPLTVLGTTGIDFAAFHLAHGWGWLVTGISLIILEHMVADE